MCFTHCSKLFDILSTLLANCISFTVNKRKYVLFLKKLCKKMFNGIITANILPFLLKLRSAICAFHYWMSNATLLCRQSKGISVDKSCRKKSIRHLNKYTMLVLFLNRTDEKSQPIFLKHNIRTIAKIEHFEKSSGKWSSILHFTHKSMSQATSWQVYPTAKPSLLD